MAFRIKLKGYSKFVAAIAGFVAVIGVAALDGEITDSEAAVILSAAITAGAVFRAPNKTVEEIQKALDEYAAKKGGE